MYLKQAGLISILFVVSVLKYDLWEGAQLCTIQEFIFLTPESINIRIVDQDFLEQQQQLFICFSWLVWWSSDSWEKLFWILFQDFKTL